MIERVIAATFAMLLAVCASAAFAHSSPNSQVTLDLAPGAIRADVIVPQSDYAAATGNPVTNDTDSLNRARKYLAERMVLRTANGRVWTKRFLGVEFAQIAGPPDLHAVIELTPPAGASDRDFQLSSQMIYDNLPDHFTLVRIGNDLAGAPGSSREVAGMLTSARPEITIDRGNASAWNSFANSFLLGAHHIAIGYDHLLFLLALLLPAPLLAAKGHWSAHRKPKETVHLLAWIVTGFTLGHSLTLVFATLADLGLPQAPVEAMIAVSVLVSAIHAIKPIFPRREPLVAFGFGTIHGLAFATLVGGYAVGPASRGIALVGFNLGIEAIQLGIVCVALPALLIVSRWPVYRPIRIGLGSFAAIAACAWLAQRVLGMGDTIAGLAETVLPWLGAALTLLSAGALVWFIVTKSRQPAVAMR